MLYLDKHFNTFDHIGLNYGFKLFNFVFIKSVQMDNLHLLGDRRLARLPRPQQQQLELRLSPFFVLAQLLVDRLIERT
jgi:hypothetical protein